MDMETKDIQQPGAEAEQTMAATDPSAQQLKKDDQGGFLHLYTDPTKKEWLDISEGAMLILKTGIVETKNMHFVAGTTEKTSENLLSFNWTKRKIKLFFAILNRIPTYKKEVREYKETIKRPTDLYLLNRAEKNFLNIKTQVFIPKRDLSLEVDDSNGASLIEQTVKEAKEIGAIETTYFFNAIIKDGNIILERTGKLLDVEEGKARIIRGGIEREVVEGLFVTYNNLLLYGDFARVPNNILTLLDTYGNDKGMFLRLFIHWVDVRGKKTSGNNIKAMVDKKVAQMKKNNTRGELWRGYLHNTVNKQMSALYKQKFLLDILGNNKETYIKTKRWTNKKTGVLYEYPNILDTTNLREDLADAIDRCVNIGLLTIGRAFTIPREESERKKVVASLCKAFPGLARDIKKLTYNDGVCCCVTFNRSWTNTDDGEVAEAVEVKDNGTEYVEATTTSETTTP